MRPLFYVIVVSCLAYPSLSFAYLDPGSGSMIFQMIAAGILGGLFAIRSYIRMGFDFLKRKIRGSRD